MAKPWDAPESIPIGKSTNEAINFTQKLDCRAEEVSQQTHVTALPGDSAYTA
jgi:hypothetical protein